jgi:hypothetical protein
LKATGVGTVIINFSGPALTQRHDPSLRPGHTLSCTPIPEEPESFVVWGVVFDCHLADSEQLCTLFGRDVFGAGLNGLVSYLSPGE